MRGGDEDNRLRPLSPNQRELLEEATARYATSLEDPEFDYLTARGLSLQTVGDYRLGVVREPLPGHEHLQGWLSIPYLDRNGQPLKMRFRRLDGYGEPKYMDLGGAGVRMFNVGAVHRAAALGGTISICEGEIDCLVLEQLGLPAVAIPGAEAWRPHHRRMLAGFSQIWVWSDPDKAGRELANKITGALRNAQVVRLTDGDVGETYLQYGPEFLLSLIGYEGAQAA